MGKKKAAEGEEAKGGKKKLVAIVVPLLLVAGVGAKMTVLKGKAEAKEEAKPVEVEGEILDVGSLTVNLADRDRHYGRVGVALVLDATAHSEEIANRVPLLKDKAITKIGAYTSMGLRSLEGQEMLRTQLAEAAHEVWEHGVLRVALTEVVVQ